MHTSYFTVARLDYRRLLLSGVLSLVSLVVMCKDGVDDALVHLDGNK